MMMTPELGYAEVDYRRARAIRELSAARDRRHHVPRRITLHLPRPRRRPVSLA
jgi:hypothetical protein